MKYLTLTKAAKTFAFCQEYELGFWILYAYKKAGKLQCLNKGTDTFPRWQTSEADIIRCFLDQNLNNRDLHADIKRKYAHVFATDNV